MMAQAPEIQTSSVTQHSAGPTNPGKEIHDSFLLNALRTQFAANSGSQTNHRDRIAIILNKDNKSLLVVKEDLTIISPWFAESCINSPPECQVLSTTTREKYGPLKHMFVLADEPANIIPGLMQVPLDYNIKAYLERFSTPKVKQESIATDRMEVDPAVLTNIIQQQKDQIGPLEAYTALFQLLKLSPAGVVPLVDKAGIRATLLSHVVSLGARLGVLPTLRTNMRVFFYKQSTRRWSAIKEDPPLWLCLAETLEEPEIYREAAIHLVGTNLQWLPSWTMPEAKMSRATMIMLGRKVDKLMLRVFRAMQALHQANVSKPKNARSTQRPVPEFVSPTHEWEAWIVVSFCRQFWAQQCAVLDDGNGVYMMSKIAHLYRVIERGGESYLPTQAVMEKVKGFSPGIPAAVIWVLPEIKKLASEQMRPLLKNNLQYRGEELGYLTCVDIEDSDFPFDVTKVGDDDF